MSSIINKIHHLLTHRFSSEDFPDTNLLMVGQFNISKMDSREIRKILDLGAPVLRVLMHVAIDELNSRQKLSEREIEAIQSVVREKFQEEKNREEVRYTHRS